MSKKPSPSSPRKELLSSWVFYALVALIAFFPCLFLNQAYFDNDLLAQFGPWRAFLKDQLAQGYFPLWNPYSLGGQPFFADLQNMMFYPPNYLTLPFSLAEGFGVFFFLHLFWASLGMHLWLKSLKLSLNACRVGALLFAFSGFFWLEIIHPPVLAAFSWLPWFFYALESLTQNPKPRNAFFAGLSFALLFLCGSFQVTVGALYGGLAYFIYRILKNKTFFFKKSKTSPVVLILFLLWGSLPLLGQLIPTWEFSSLTDRGKTHTYEEFNGNLGLSPASLYQLILPRVTLPKGQSLGHALQETHSDTEASPFVANLGYLGVWFPFLLLAAYGRKEKADFIFFSAFALAGLLICLGKMFFLHRAVCFLLPGFSLIRVPFRFIYLYVLAGAALGALGFDALEKSIEDRRSRRELFIGGGLYAFTVYLAALFNPAQTWPEIAALTLGFASGFLFLWKPKSPKPALWLFAFSLLLPLVVHSRTGFQPGPASNFDYGKKSDFLAPVRQELGPNRLIFDNAHMVYPIEFQGRPYLINYPQNAASALGLKNVGGYNPLILQSKEDLSSLPIPATLRLFAIGGIISGENHGPIPGFQLEFLKPSYFYHSSKPLPCVFAPSKWEVVPPAEEVDQLKNPGFDPYQTALLSQALPSKIAVVLSRQPAPLAYQIKQDEADDQLFSIQTDQNSLAVFSETLFPGWKALLDGQPAPLFTADHLLRCLYLPAGKHEVEFQFQPFWWRPLQAGSLLWILATLAVFLSRRKTHA